MNAENAENPENAANAESPQNSAVPRLVAARCLRYPDELLYAQLPLLRTALSEHAAPGAARLRDFVDTVAATEPLDLAAHYTATFDTRNRRCLYLTWWADGDTRRRGLSLVRLKRIYRDHGLEFSHEELPDFLPAVLEFAGRHEEPGTELLQEHRAGLELLRLALIEAGTPYADVLEAVCATLPGASPTTKAEAKALAKAGPPQESVGLEPRGPGVEPFGPGVELPWPGFRERKDS
ncbi:Nitrate reductase-like protein NarX [Streptomyces hundungensis]|uniref:Nitrate reductase-like protein NarX n=1 Tax=Streptomyces hundungensis TaxID=1077946 RepID=A0A387HIC0_9ACTN|nr:nitrate reductase molybdenum cofactor assembly chaperone [Streptomyces hundungensis]AYG80590.1 Nitrate reductase-like protein NarX [Streptomyces hundungensis]